MTNDRIEGGLREEIPADEHDYRPRPMPATVAQAEVEVASRSRRGSIAAVAAGVAALALVAAVGWAAWQSVGDGGIGTGGGSAAPSPSVEPSSSVAGVPRACGVDDFRVVSDPWGGAAGSRGTSVVFRVVPSTASCLLPTSVGAEIRDYATFGRTLLVQGASPTMPAREVAAGTQLEIGVSWSNWCGPEPEGPRLVIVIGQEAVLVIVDDPLVLVPPCNGVGQPTALNVTAFEPSQRAPIGD